MTTPDKAGLEALIEERDADGVFRIHRTMFTDPSLFEFEMEHVFAAGWVYLAHESQVPKPNDFVTCYIGQQPVILSRQIDGGLKAFLNTCQHRGAMLETRASGNRKLFICPFHSWSYRNDGELIGCGDMAQAGYGPGFSKANLGLKAVARVENYRGFIFGSLNRDIMSLPDYLGGAKAFIDLVVDQDENGQIDVIPGPQVYTFDGNWKLQAENGVDGYHVGSIHSNYILTTNNRQRIAAGNDVVSAVDVSGFNKLAGGYYAFENGHVVLWNELPNPQVRPAHASHEKFEARFGADRAHWMTHTWRNLFIFPNLLLMDQMSSQIRTFRPLAVDKTEVKAFGFVPHDEAAHLLPVRIRQYEDFFNASGLATPDDLAAFNATQAGFAARHAEWSDVSRGWAHMRQGGDERAEKLGCAPQYYGTHLQDEGIFLNQHRYWRKMMMDGAQRTDLLEAAE
ncbi:MAG: Rieske 2Fe-2S domain-containing protein [Sphingobium sp.]|uniref:Rieske 2Fe-2S domain-containing protein n=1 Tax=Sphingobium sp. TaxID=1912891 RepID=UPI0029A15546|nr:Rieske 2Fe-2S domain-containing protein [Sphingobium sp.]MDX3908579.1 Rieske 2Fe-2S domain-containing protein [Sphingobium sp.]